MAYEHPDVLDHLGKTPREFGAVHVHVEPVARGENGRALATVWCQAAFSPQVPGATLEVLQHKSELPSLEGGVVMKGRIPLEVPADAHKLLFVVQSTLHKKAERVRQAWKLFDTIEQGREEGGGGGGLEGVAGIALANMVALPLGFVVIPTGFARGGGTSTPTKVHKARELPPGFVAEVVRGTPELLASPQWTEVWRPGQELPSPALPVWGADPVPVPVAPLSAATGRRRCGRCDFSGKREDFGTDRYCPSCGFEWE